MSSGLRISDDELRFDENGMATYAGALLTGFVFGAGSRGRFEFEYRNGLQSGDSIYFYDNGMVRSKAQMLDGAKHGVTTEYSPEGLTAERSEWEMGIMKLRYARSNGYELELVYNIERDNPGQFAMLSKLRKVK